MLICHTSNRHSSICDNTLPASPPGILTRLHVAMGSRSRSSDLWLRAASLWLLPTHHQKCCPLFWQQQGAETASIKLDGGLLWISSSPSYIYCALLSLLMCFSYTGCSLGAWICHYYLAFLVPSRAVINPEEGHCNQHIAVQASQRNGVCLNKEETSWASETRTHVLVMCQKLNLFLVAVLSTPESNTLHYQKLCFTLLFHSNPLPQHRALHPVAGMFLHPVAGMFYLNLWLDSKNESKVFFRFCKYSCPGRMKSRTVANVQRQIVLRNKN